MKQMIFLASILFSFAALAGVGGSVGGSGRLGRDLNFYIKSRSFDPKVPVISFQGDDSDSNVAVNDVCIRNEDLLESKKEVEVKHYDDKGFVTHSTMEVVSRPRSYIQTIIKPHIFRSNEIIEQEVKIPRDYLIDVYSTHENKDRGPKLAVKINYSIEDCQ